MNKGTPAYAGFRAYARGNYTMSDMGAIVLGFCENVPRIHFNKEQWFSL